MINNVRFENYRSLKSVTLGLSSLTVLVGPNGCGKSSAMRGLMLERPLSAEDVWRRQPGSIAEIEVAYAGHTLRRRSDRRGHVGNGAPHRSQLLHLDLQALRSANTASLAQQLEPHGGNLTNAFASLTRAEQGKLAKSFSEWIPTFGDVIHRPRGGGLQELLFQDRWSPDTWYRTDEVSDGTMLALAYLVLQYQRDSVDLVLVEEPERGLHPYLLGALVRFLRGLAQGELGTRPMQIVLATHSADLLDHVNPEEVRLLSRSSSDGSVTVDSVASGEPGWREAFRNYDDSLGSMWKSGGLRGVPGGG